MGYTSDAVRRPHARTLSEYLPASRARSIIYKAAVVAGLALTTFFGVQAAEHVATAPQPELHQSVDASGRPDLTDANLKAFGATLVENSVTNYVDIAVGAGAFGALVLGGVGFAAKRDHNRHHHPAGRGSRGYPDRFFADDTVRIAPQSEPQDVYVNYRELFVEAPLPANHLLTPADGCVMLDLLEPTI